MDPRTFNMGFGGELSAALGGMGTGGFQQQGARGQQDELGQLLLGLDGMTLNQDTSGGFFSAGYGGQGMAGGDVSGMGMQVAGQVAVPAQMQLAGQTASGEFIPMAMAGRGAQQQRMQGGPGTHLDAMGDLGRALFGPGAVSMTVAGPLGPMQLTGPAGAVAGSLGLAVSDGRGDGQYSQQGEQGYDGSEGLSGPMGMAGPSGGSGGRGEWQGGQGGHGGFDRPRQGMGSGGHFNEGRGDDQYGYQEQRGYRGYQGGGDGDQPYEGRGSDQGGRWAQSKNQDYHGQGQYGRGQGQGGGWGDNRGPRGGGMRRGGRGYDNGPGPRQGGSDRYDGPGQGWDDRRGYDRGQGQYNDRYEGRGQGGYGPGPDRYGPDDGPGRSGYGPGPSRGNDRYDGPGGRGGSYGYDQGGYGRDGPYHGDRYEGRGQGGWGGRSGGGGREGYSQGPPRHGGGREGYHGEDPGPAGSEDGNGRGRYDGPAPGSGSGADGVPTLSRNSSGDDGSRTPSTHPASQGQGYGQGGQGYGSSYGPSGPGSYASGPRSFVGPVQSVVSGERSSSGAPSPLTSTAMIPAQMGGVVAPVQQMGSAGGQMGSYMRPTASRQNSSSGRSFLPAGTLPPVQVRRHFAESQWQLLRTLLVRRYSAVTHRPEHGELTRENVIAAATLFGIPRLVSQLVSHPHKYGTGEPMRGDRFRAPEPAGIGAIDGIPDVDLTYPTSMIITVSDLASVPCEGLPVEALGWWHEHEEGGEGKDKSAAKAIADKTATEEGDKAKDGKEGEGSEAPAAEGAEPTGTGTATGTEDKDKGEGTKATEDSAAAAATAAADETASAPAKAASAAEADETTSAAVTAAAVGLLAAELVSQQRFKTKLCHAWVRSGGHCPRGDRCDYAHGPEEIRSAPNVKSDKYKQRLCRAWLDTSGAYCPHADRCAFAHGVHELRIRLPSSMMPGKDGEELRFMPAAPAPLTSNLRPLFDAGTPKRSKTGLCMAWLRGACAAAAKAAADTVERGTPHPDTVLAMMDESGRALCSAGDACPFAHGIDELRLPSQGDLSRYLRDVVFAPEGSPASGAPPGISTVSQLMAVKAANSSGSGTTAEGAAGGAGGEDESASPSVATPIASAAVNTGPKPFREGLREAFEPSSSGAFGGSGGGLSSSPMTLVDAAAYSASLDNPRPLTGSLAAVDLAVLLLASGVALTSLPERLVERIRYLARAGIQLPTSLTGATGTTPGTAAGSKDGGEASAASGGAQAGPTIVSCIVPRADPRLVEAGLTPAGQLAATLAARSPITAVILPTIGREDEGMDGRAKGLPGATGLNSIMSRTIATLGPVAATCALLMAALQLRFVRLPSIPPEVLEASEHVAWAYTGRRPPTASAPSQAVTGGLGASGGYGDDGSQDYDAARRASAGPGGFAAGGPRGQVTSGVRAGGQGRYGSLLRWNKAGQ